MALEQGRPLILYTTALKWSLRAMLPQCNDEGEEHVLYCISKTMVGAKINYSSMEKIGLPLVFVIQKLRHYLPSHQITIISSADPLKYILSEAVLSGRLDKWVMLLAPFDIKFIA